MDNVVAMKKLWESRAQAKEQALNEAMEKLWENKSKELIDPINLKNAWDEFFADGSYDKPTAEWQEKYEEINEKLFLEDCKIDKMMEIAYDYYY